MNKLYADRNGIPIESIKQNMTANVAVKKMIERQRATRENSQRILDYYKNGQKGNARG